MTNKIYLSGLKLYTEKAVIIITHHSLPTRGKNT